MLGIYLIELGVFLIILLILKFKEKSKIKENGIVIRDGNVSFKDHLKTNKTLYVILIVLFVCLIVCQYLFEIPQMTLEKTNIEAKSNEDIVIPYTVYHFNNITDEVTVDKGSIDTQKVGVYNVKYKVKTLFGTYNKEFKINVVDTLAPDITLEGGEDYKLSYLKEYTEPGVKAIDLNEGDLSSNITSVREDISDTEFNIKYTVEDSFSNKAEKIRHVTIIDDIPPVITLNGEENTIINVGQAYIEKGAKANDAKDGDISSNIEIEGNVDISKAGEYSIKYTVKDSKGNEATKIRVVTVVKKEATNNKNGGKKGVIYLTFDDGPSTNITPKILDILKRKGVKATFFILNYDNSKEYIVKREANEGHTIAIHGYSHDYKTIYKSEEAFMNNIVKLRDKIKKSTGYDSTIIRFPGGSSNTVSKFNPGIMTKLTNKVLANGYRYFDWNVDSNDAGGAKDSNAVYNNVVKNLSKSRANVVLMHDFSGNNKTLNALDSIINYGINNGYTFEKITPSTAMVTHHVNN